MSRRFDMAPTLTRSEISLLAPDGVSLPEVATVWFRTDDGVDLNFRRLAQPSQTSRGPVMLVHGSGVRADLFCPPSVLSLPAMLYAEGFDVWMLNWRASIDLVPVQYTFDDAAVFDFPAAVATICRQTGSDTVAAVVHCQGSHAFMMSLASGLLPKVTRVVANSTAMHPQVRRSAAVKLPVALATLGHLTEWFNPQHGLYATSVTARLMDWMVRAVHHECDNAVCKHASFVYGVGFPTMWEHDNLDDVTHDWIKGEFAHVPVSLFRQTRRCLAAGRLVPVRGYPQISPRVALDPPQTDADVLFVCGTDNRTFRPAGMRTSFEHFLEHGSGRYDLFEPTGYGHLDAFLGKYAAHDVFPRMIDWLVR